jgi:hypothetical protein
MDREDDNNPIGTEATGTTVQAPDVPETLGSSQNDGSVQNGNGTQEEAFAERDAFLETLRDKAQGTAQGTAQVTAQGTAQVTAPRDEGGRFRARDATQAGAGEPGPDGMPPVAAGTEKEEGAGQPKTLDELEAEALENVKSGRGKERIKQVFAERRQLEAANQGLEKDITDFKEMVMSTGMQPEEFVRTLEFGRLMNAGDEQSLRLALQMVEEQRETICKHLGIEAPGVDPLSDFPDLRSAVENLEINKTYALQLAKVRRQEHAKQQVQQAQHASQQEMQQYQQSIAQASQTAEAYFKTREHEADYPAKMAQIQARFKDPAFVNEFISTYEPRQWFGVFKLMYDNLAVATPQKALSSQPMRSRPTLSGMPQAPAGDHVGAMKSVLAQMGIGGSS